MSRARALLTLVLLTTVLFAACSTEDKPGLSGDQADDPQLVLGEQVYLENCARCHGNAGGGGAGPKLADGRVVEVYSDPANQAELIRKGSGSMPAWEAKLTAEEIDAVVRYTREVL